MLTPLQKEKITHYFQVVLDQNRNGILDEYDFVEIGESLCILWEHKPQTKEYEKMIERCKGSWRMFESYFSKQNKEANLEQFLLFFEKILAPGKEELFQKFVMRVVTDVFDAFDVNGDGIISINEYVDIFMCYHVKIKYSAKAFVKLDRNGDDQISKKELLDAVSGFFRSNDEKSPENWLFGFWGDKEY